MLSFHSMLPLKFQGTWMIPCSDLFLRKQTSEQKLKPNSNSEYLCQSTQRRISCNTFFWRSIPLELYLELNCQNSFHLYPSLWLFYSRCARPSGPGEIFPSTTFSRRLLPPYSIASLTKKCVAPKLCTRQMAMFSQ